MIYVLATLIPMLHRE